MILNSLLFQGNAALEACAVKDSAHITKGAQGDHVGKIQFALFKLDQLVIDRSELVSQTFGDSTAAAVLDFKKKRAIVNRTYQTSADNIVGKMTVAALDRELQAAQRPFPVIGDCARSIRPNFVKLVQSGPGVRSNIVAAPSGNLVQLNALVSIVVQQAASSRLDGFPLTRQIDLAKDKLLAHGITLQVVFGNPIADTLPFSGTVLIDDDLLQLRKLSEDFRPGFTQLLRVIVCRMPAHFGETKRNVLVGTQRVKPFVMLNSQERSADDSTLLHEMIHASLNGPDHDPEPESVFFDNHIPKAQAPDRTVLKANRALSIATSFYSSKAAVR